MFNPGLVENTAAALMETASVAICAGKWAEVDCVLDRAVTAANGGDPDAAAAAVVIAGLIEAAWVRP